MSEVDVAQEENEEENYSGTFYQSMRDCGYSVKQAHEINDWRKKHLTNIQDVTAQLTLRRVVPLEVFDAYGGWHDMSAKKREHVLWLAGINTNTLPYCLDVGKYHLGDKHSVGWFVFGQERNDKAWITQRVEGVRVASNEAVLSYNPPRKKAV
jgi:hypothetical protein